jgi:hypothetical protein
MREISGRKPVKATTPTEIRDTGTVSKAIKSIKETYVSG